MLQSTKSALGERHGRLLITEFSEPRGDNRTWIICKCDCGKETKTRLDAVRSGKTRSCGCLQKDSSSKDLATRFHEKWEPEPYSGCWLWTGMVRQGYGELWFHAGHEKAHRISWRLHFGDIPQGLFVCHKCDTPLCVNPNHLFLGTHLDNMTDCVSKRRHAFGDRHGRRKLDSETAEIIRNEHGNLQEIADRYCICEQTVRLIKNNRIWNH
jgi:hypothetical protein